jgi:uncharacterized protein with HEPN domain
MKLDENKYLSDIEFAIDLINSFIKDYHFTQYQSDQKTKSAVERQLGIIGEAVNKYIRLSERELSGSKEIIAFRNRIIHAYNNIEDEIVWAILKNHIPKLKKEVSTLLNQN